MKKNINELIKQNDELQRWLHQRVRDTREFTIVTNKKELGKILEKQKPLNSVLIIPSEPNSEWWAKYVGPCNPNVFFITGTKFAIVVFTTKSVEIPNPTAIIDELYKYGWTKNSIALKFGVSSMSINRAHKGDNIKGFDDKINLINMLLNLLEESQAKETGA